MELKPLPQVVDGIRDPSWPSIPWAARIQQSKECDLLTQSGQLLGHLPGNDAAEG
jgi:hypothetical protein